MGRRLFHLTIPQEVQDQNLTGADLTAGRTATGEAYPVEKSVGASTAHTVLVDNAADLVAEANLGNPGNVTQVGDTITFLNAANPLPEGNWVLIGRNIVVGDATTAGNLRIPDTPNSPTPDTTTKLKLINCNVTYINVHVFAGVTFAVGVGSSADATRANDQFELLTNSLDSYGTLHSFADLANGYTRFSDFIQSEFYFAGTAAGPPRLASSGGGRWINSTVSAYDNRTIINAYGLNIYENAVLNNLVYRHGNAGTGQNQQLVIDRPNFGFPQQPSYIELNISPESTTAILGLNNQSNLRSLPVQMIGGPSFGTNATGTDSLFGNVNGSAITGGLIIAGDVDRVQSGIIQYYGFGNRYFSTPIQTEADGAAGIRARLTANIFRNGLTSAAGSIGGRIVPSIGGAQPEDFLSNNGISITGLTRADGRLAPETYNVDGTTEEAGLLNFWNWDEVPAGNDIVDGITDLTVADNVWNATPDRVTSPAGMMLIPIARGYNTTGLAVQDDFDLYNVTVTEEVRSYRWDVDEQEREIAYPAYRENLQIPQQGITVADLSQSVVKTQNINATTGLPDISFPAGTTVSINDIRDAHRAAWSDYEFDLPVPTIFSNALTLGITLDNEATTDYTATSATEITVRGNGIAADGTNDHYLADVNIDTLTMGGGTIEGHTLTVANDILNAGEITSSTLSAGGNLETTGAVNSMLNVGGDLSVGGGVNSTLNVTGDINVATGAVLDRVLLQNNPTVNLSANTNIVPLNRDTMTGVLGSGWDLTVPEGFTASATPPINRLFTPQGVGGTYEITLTPDQAMSYFGIRMTDDDTDDSLETSNNITFRTPPLDESFVTFDVPASFDGRIAIAWRDQGLTGTGAWTLVGSVYDFTGAHPTIATLGNANSDYGRGATGVPYVVTAGRGYRMRFQEINFPTTPGESAVFSVFPDTDTNYTTAISGINTGAVITDDTLVEDAGTGHIEINITHADRSTTATTWNSAFTARVFAECRNDVDYISEVLENGAVEDFIQLTGSGTILLGGVVTFTRGAGETSQQFIQGVDFMPGASITFSQTVTGCNDVVIFPASDVITGQQIRDALAEDFSNQTGNLQQLNDNVRIASVKPLAVQDAQQSTADLPNN